LTVHKSGDTLQRSRFCGSCISISIVLVVLNWNWVVSLFRRFDSRMRCIAWVGRKVAIVMRRTSIVHACKEVSLHSLEKCNYLPHLVWREYCGGGSCISISIVLVVLDWNWSRRRWIGRKVAIVMRRKRRIFGGPG
jgi:hypothetical protein